MRAYHRWTAYELNTVRQMSERRCTNKEIAEALGTTERKVQDFKNRHGIVHELDPSPQAEKAREYQRNYYWKKKNRSIHGNNSRKCASVCK